MLTQDRQDRPFENWVIVSDLDGTFIGSNYRISRENVEAVERFIAGGGEFTIATGRSKPAVDCLHLPMTLPAILFNGTVIYDYENDKPLWVRKIPSVCKDLARDLHANFPGIGIEWVTLEAPYLLVDNAEMEHIRIMEKGEYITRTMEDLDHLPGTDLKLLLAWDNENLLRVQKYLEEKVAGKIPLKIEFSYPTILECMSLEANKGLALEVLADFMDIPLQQVIALGDNLNDLEFLQTAGLGIAVENAHAGLKKHADMVTIHHDQNAIANLVDSLACGQIRKPG